MLKPRLHKITVHLNKNQLVKLKRGHGTRLLHSQLTGHHTAHVPTVIARRHHTAKMKGCGMVLHRKDIVGGNILGEIAKLVRPHASTFLRKEVLPKLNDLADSGLKKLGLGHRRHHGMGVTAPFAAPPLRGFSSGIPAMVSGTGTRHKHRRHGGNIFSDIGNYFKKPSNILGTLGKVAGYLPIPGANYVSKGLDLASSGAKALGHGVRRHKRHRVACGLVPPGGHGLYLPGSSGRGILPHRRELRHLKGVGLNPPGY